MTVRIRIESLAAIDAAFGNMEYGIIGGAAIAEHGNARNTNDVDVVVPRNVSEVIEGHLISRGMARTVGGGLGYIAFAGCCYELDYTLDRDISQNFEAFRDSQWMGQSRARVVNIDYLLNSKAYCYLDRI